jgi:hypothetical protein
MLRLLGSPHALHKIQGNSLNTRFAEAVIPSARPAHPAASARVAAVDVLFALLWTYHFVIECAAYWDRKIREYLLLNVKNWNLESSHGRTTIRDRNCREVEVLDCDKEFGEKSTFWGQDWNPLLLASYFATFRPPDEKSAEMPLQDVKPLLDDARASASFEKGCASKSTDRMVMALIHDRDPHEEVGQRYAIATTLLLTGISAGLCRFPSQGPLRRRGAG